MADKTDRTGNADPGDDKPGWSSTAIAGAAIGSAALAAALLYMTRRRDSGKTGRDPIHPEMAPETD